MGSKKIELKKEKNIKEFKLDFYKIFWIFMVGCVFGVISETIYFFLKYNIIESRSGLIYGPLNLVYGFGAIALLLPLYKIKDTKKIFVFSALIGGAVEFLCSWFQEANFGTISWDYVNNFLNIGGRTDLLHMIFWGILGTLFIKHIFPWLYDQIEKVPHSFKKAFTLITIIFMIFNISISYLAVYRQVERHQGKLAVSKMELFLDQKYNDEYLSKIFTNAKKVSK